MTSIDTGAQTSSRFWFDGFVMEVLVDAAESEGALSVCEQHHRAGYGTPVHLHENEDQTLHVLAGAITAWLDPNGDDRVERTLTPGDTVFLPRGVAHAFRVDEDGTRLLEINTPGGFEHFHIDAGEPAAHDGFPEPTPPDIERLVRVGQEYGCQILGPPVGT